MDKKDLVQKLTLLKETKPREDWVLFAKNRIIEQETVQPQRVGQESLIKQVGHVINYLRYLEKPAYVFAALAFVVLGGVGYQISQNSLPGDALYSVRSVIERATTSSDPLVSLEVAQRRLNDLKRVVEANKVKNLSQATQEFNQSISEASKGLLQLVENEPKKALQASRELVQLQEGKAQIEQVLGVSFGEQETFELQDTTRILVEIEFADVTTRTLTIEQEELFEKAVEAYKDQKYEQALEYVWMIANN